jgi:hypothetical protein
MLRLPRWWILAGTCVWCLSLCICVSFYQTEGSHTTNHLEGSDNKIKKKVHHAHPHIYLIIEVLQNTQEFTECTIFTISIRNHRLLVQVKEMGCYVYHVDEYLLVPVSGVYHSVSASLWWVSTSCCVLDDGTFCKLLGIVNSLFYVMYNASYILFLTLCVLNCA